MRLTVGTFVFVWYITTCVWYVHLCTKHNIVMREIPFYSYQWEEGASDTDVDLDRTGMLICWLLGVCMWRGWVCGGSVYVEGVCMWRGCACGGGVHVEGCVCGGGVHVEGCVCGGGVYVEGVGCTQ